MSEFLFISRALAEEVETKPSYFQTAFKKLGELPVWGWVLVVVFLAGGFALWKSLSSKGTTKKSVWTPQTMAMGAMCMALSVVLSRIRLFTMPNGGSITPASMLPLMLFAYVYGVGPGLMLGALYGLLDYAFGGWFLSVPQFLLDYPIAFAMLGLAGLTSRMENEQAGLTIGVIIGSLGRYLAAVLAGVVFWAESRTGREAWSYSLAYNGTYMGLECIICVVICVLVGQRLVKALRQQARR